MPNARASVLGRVYHSIRFAPIALGLAFASAASGQVRVVAYNITGLAGDQAALKNVIASFHTDDVGGFAAPVGLLLLSEVHTTNVAALTTLINQAAPAGVTYAPATYTGTSTQDGASGAEGAWYRTDLLSEVTSGFADMATGGSRNTSRWLFQLKGYTSTAARFYVYGSHLKASTGSTNVSTRLTGVQTIRANCDALGSGVRAIYAGDMNFYTNTESGYAAFVAAGNGQAVDPLGTADWTGAANARKHSQSPRDIQAGGLIGGGLNDRFDMMLPTAQLMDGAGISLIANSYRAVGNDGAHYGVAINAGNNNYFAGNTVRSNALAGWLFNAADHIPVLMDLKVPAWNTAVLGTVPTRVVQGAVATAEVRVANDAPGDVVAGIDPLVYTVAGSGVLSGSLGGTAALTPSYTSVNVPIVTSIVGLRTGTATVTSSNEAVQNPSIPLSVSVQVLRASNPSFSTAVDTDSTPLAITGATVGGAAVDGTVSVANFGFTADQATMDIDQVQVPAGPFSYVSGAATGIGATPGTVRFRFNPAGLSAGTYTATATITTSDENVPGETTAQVTVSLSAIVGGGRVGDLNGDGIVNGADLGALLSQWGANGGPADLNGDGIVNGADIGTMLANWG